MPPRRATPRAASQPGMKKDQSKAATPSVLHYFGGTSSQNLPLAPTVTTLEIQPSSEKSIKCEHYTKQSLSDSGTKQKAHTPAASEFTPELIFTHGAGGGLSTPALTCFAAGFAQIAPTLVFEGASNLIARTKSFQAVLEHVLAESNTKGPLPALGGRSLGARAAVQTANARNSASAASTPVKALVLVSYPLTGPGGDVRDVILHEIHPGVDVLFISGDRDGMCNLELLDNVRNRMQARSWLAVVRGADHSMSTKPASAIEARRKASGSLAARWLASRDRGRTECVVVGTEVEEWKATEDGGDQSGAGEKRKAEAAEATGTKKKKVK